MSWKTLALAAALVTGAPALATADTNLAQQTPDAAQAAPQASQFSDAKLDAFALAWLQVRDIAQRYEDRLNQLMAENKQQEMSRVGRQATEEIKAAIEAQDGITLVEYQAVMTAAKADEAFADRLRALLQTAAEK